MCQRRSGDTLHSHVVALRHAPKGDTGHTAESIAIRFVLNCSNSHRWWRFAASFIHLVQTHVFRQTNEQKAQLLVDASIKALLAIVTDGGGNVCAAARLLVGGERGDDALLARICVSHTLQLFLRYFWCVMWLNVSTLLRAACSLHDKQLATALAIVNYFARYTRAVASALSRSANLQSSVSMRWNSQIDAARSALAKKAVIERFATHAKAPVAFKER